MSESAVKCDGGRLGASRALARGAGPALDPESAAVVPPDGACAVEAGRRHRDQRLGLRVIGAGGRRTVSAAGEPNRHESSEPSESVAAAVIVTAVTVVSHW